jgi:hypothetical protein
MAGNSALFQLLLFGLGLVGFISIAIWIQRRRYRSILGIAGITEQQKSALGCQLASAAVLIALVCSFMFLAANADIGQQAQSLYLYMVIALVATFIVAGYIAVSAINNRAIMTRVGPLTGSIAILLGIMMIIGLLVVGGWFIFLFLKAK